jgi:hypothetical protein
MNNDELKLQLFFSITFWINKSTHNAKNMIGALNLLRCILII